MKKICIIDYGLGNIRSAEQSLKRIVKENNQSAEIIVVKNAKDLHLTTHIILPGQGAFASCMEGLKTIPGMVEELSENVLIQKKPFLGICVGMQLLATEGKEKGNHKGLGWIAGKVIKIKKKNSIKIPHMGWNTVKIISKHPILKRKKFESYFVHSYNFVCKDKKNILATCSYQQDITAIVGKENIIGTQFHPEKSQKVGLEILKNFVSWNY